MRRMYILQLGDIHHPEHAGPAADIKDDGFPLDVVTMVTHEVLRNPLVAAAYLNDKLSPVLAVCGDLTSWAEAANYQSATSLIRSVFQLDADEDRLNRAHVAIGNHDVDRKKVPTDDSTSHEKYAMAVEAWLPHDILAIDRPRGTLTEAGEVAIHTWTLNSCVGSGVYRDFPEDVKAGMRKTVASAFAARSKAAEPESDASPIDTALGGLILDVDLDEVYEQLDTPAIEAAHLDQVVNEIRALGRNTIPVVLAHHNLLPQAAPRVAPYTELLNGGSVRSRLAACGRPVIYLHGHIHASVVEVVEQYQPRLGRVVCISAPLLVEGFNLIEVQFSESSALLGLVISRYRVENSGDVNADEPIRIPLVDRVPAPNDLLVDLARVFSSQTRLLRMPELITEFKKISPRSVTDDQIADLVLEAEWLGRVDVTSRSEEHRYWQVRSAL